MVAPVIRPARVLDQDLNSNWQEEVLSYHLVWNINPNSSKHRLSSANEKVPGVYFTVK